MRKFDIDLLTFREGKETKYDITQVTVEYDGNLPPPVIEHDGKHYVALHHGFDRLYVRTTIVKTS